MKKFIVIGIVGTMFLTAIPAPINAVLDTGVLCQMYYEMFGKVYTGCEGLVDETKAPATVACTFTRNLSPGISGADVKCLQEYLNGAGFTVATTGAGSAGNETQYYGSLTRAAVKKWQDAHNLAYGAWGGYFGPMSRAKFDEVATVTPPKDDDDVDDTAPTPDPGVDPTEGATEAVLSGTPASNANITNVVNLPVLGLNIKALDSNMSVRRLDLYFDARTTSHSGTRIHPATILEEISLYDGNTLSIEKVVSSADFTKITSGTYVDWYRARITGFSFDISEGKTEKLTAKITANQYLENDRFLKVRGHELRAVDTLGLNQTEDLPATDRRFTLKYDTIGSSTLSALVNPDNYQETNIKVDDEEGVDDVELLKFDVKSTRGNSEITDVQFTYQGTASATTLKLYNGSISDANLLGSVAAPDAAGATTSITDLAYVVAKDVTKTFIVTADYAADESGTSAVDVSQIDYEKPDLSTGSVTDSVTGNSMYLNKAVPVFTFISKSNNSIKPTDNASAYVEGIIKFSVEADGADLRYFAGGTSADASLATGTLQLLITGHYGSSTIAADTIQVDRDLDYAVGYIPDGYPETYTVTIRLKENTASENYVYFDLEKIYWEMGENTSGVTSFAVKQDWGLRTFKTDSAYLY